LLSNVMQTLVLASEPLDTDAQQWLQTAAFDMRQFPVDRNMLRRTYSSQPISKKYRYCAKKRSAGR
jgi:hypothetical protein